jgi:hypothetical protein
MRKDIQWDGNIKAIFYRPDKVHDLHGIQIEIVY